MRERQAGGCGGENDKNRERWIGWRRKGSQRRVKSQRVEEEEGRSRVSHKRAFYPYVKFTFRAKHN